MTGSRQHKKASGNCQTLLQLLNDLFFQPTDLDLRNIQLSRDLLMLHGKIIAVMNQQMLPLIQIMNFITQGNIHDDILFLFVRHLVLQQNRRAVIFINRFIQ